MQMRACFGMHGDDVGAGLGEGFDIGIDGGDHQMYVEHPVGVGPQGRHHTGAKRDVRHEVAVHDVDMAVAGTGIRTEAHTSELQSLMRITYHVLCLKKTRFIKYYTPKSTN